MDFGFQASHARLDSGERGNDRREVRILGRSPAEQLALNAGAWGAGGGKDVDGLQEVGLTLAVLAAEEEDAGPRLEAEATEVSEVDQPQLAEPHWRYALSAGPAHVTLRVTLVIVA